MKLRRLAILASCLVAACDTSADGTLDTPASTIDGGDAALPGTDAGGADAHARLDLGASDVSVYAGAKATVTITVIPAGSVIAWSWSLVSAPAGSAVTPATVAATATPALDLVTDVVGDYVLRATATAAGTPSATLEATVHALAAPVFYTRATFGPNGGEVAVRVAGHDGSEEHAAACAITFDSSESATYRTRTLFAAATTMDVWEAPAGKPSRFAFSGARSLTQDDAGTFDAFLIAGDTTNACTREPATLRAARAPAGAYAQPRFSPDGARVAFLEPGAAGFAVATIGFDGADFRTLGAVLAVTGDAGAGSGEASILRPEWRDATHVAWARPLGGGSFAVMVATDAAGPSAAAPETLTTCVGATTPHRIAFLPDGSIVAAFAPATGQPTDIFVLAPVAAGGGACTVVRNLTNLAGASSRAHDLDVSPDGRTVAYLHYDATAHGGVAASGNDGELYLVATDGSGAPHPAGAPVLGRIGPRWIGGGTRLAWTRAGDVADGGDPRVADDVTVVLPDGGAARDLARGNGVDEVVGAVGPGGSCAVGRGRASAPSIALGWIVAAFAVACRRSRIVSRRRR